MAELRGSGVDVLSDEDKRNLVRELYLDPVKFLRTILPHWFTEPLTWMHRGYLAILLRRTDFLPLYGELDKIIENFVYKKNPWDEEEEGKPIFRLEKDGSVSLIISRFTEIMMPRGIGKTTLANGAEIFMGCYKVRKFVLKVGETATHAEAQLMNCRKEFEFNNKITLLFGSLKGADKWSEETFVLSNGFIMSATGRGGQVRGRNINSIRPDFIHLDDVEDKESVSTAEQRKKTLDWFMGDVLPALGELNTDATILLNGTLLHNEALLVSLGRDPTFTTIVLGALDRRGNPVFPKYMNEEKLARKKDMFSRQGKLELYYLEYFNKLTSEDTMALKPSDIDRTLLERPLAIAIAHDPAISKKREADDAAFAVVGLYSAGHFQIETVEGFKGLTPQEAVQKFFSLRALWKEKGVPLLCGLETVAYQEALYDLMTEEMARRNDYFLLEKIRFSSEKKARILGQLQPRYKAHLMHHRREFPEYESQMKEFPSGHDDLLDVVAMALSLLDSFITSSIEKSIDSDEESSYYEDEAGESGGL